MDATPRPAMATLSQLRRRQERLARRVEFLKWRINDRNLPPNSRDHAEVVAIETAIDLFSAEIERRLHAAPTKRTSFPAFQVDVTCTGKEEDTL